MYNSQADNAGEVVFDRILLEEIKTIYSDKDIYYAVKHKPIINDALREDAKACGVDRTARVISNGSDAPGTIMTLCSKKFKRIYKDADLVISKIVSLPISPLPSYIQADLS